MIALSVNTVGQSQCGLRDHPHVQWPEGQVLSCPKAQEPALWALTAQSEAQLPRRTSPYSGPHLGPNILPQIPVSQPLRSTGAVPAELTSWPMASFLGHHHGTWQEPTPCTRAPSSANLPKLGLALTQEFYSRSTPLGTHPGAGGKHSGTIYSGRKLESLQRPNNGEIIKQMMGR